MIRPDVSCQCVKGGAATKKMMTTETRSMETRSMGTYSIKSQRCVMAVILPWKVIIGRWVGARCRGDGMFG